MQVKTKQQLRRRTLIRIGLKTVLSSHKSINIVAEVDDEEELLEAAVKSPNAVVVIDYTAEGFSIDSIPKLVQEYTGLNFLAVTFEQAGYVVVNALKVVKEEEKEIKKKEEEAFERRTNHLLNLTTINCIWITQNRNRT